jgi:hypothetical protein
MKNLFPVLIVLAGLGCSVSFAQSKQTQDPFSRYLAGIKANQPDVALVRFAGECGVDVSRIRSKFAVSSGGNWIIVKNLALGLQHLDSDFFSSAQVWVNADQTVIELWANSDDVGSEVRYHDCFSKGRLIHTEVVSWVVPTKYGSTNPIWGYARRWDRNENESLKRTASQFVDGIERPIPRPKLEADDVKGLDWSPSLGPLGELKLPPSMLR